VCTEISRKLAFGIFDYNHQLEVYAPNQEKAVLKIRKTLLITFFGLGIGLALAVLLKVLQQQFSFLMITPTFPYPVVFEWDNVWIVVATIVLFGMLSSWIASGTVT
jgi:lipoprotein-releasing system permease protein